MSAEPFVALDHVQLAIPPGYAGFVQPLGDGIDSGSRFGARRAGLTGGNEACRAPLCVTRHGLGPRLERTDDSVDLAPRVAETVLDALGVPESNRNWPDPKDAGVWDALPRGHTITPPDVLFKKIEDEQVAEWATRFGAG